MTKTVYAVITGRGPFPLVMLSRDSCSPLTEEDSHNIRRSFTNSKLQPWAINVECRLLEKNTSPWTIDRWKSFGCQIQPLGDRRPGQIVWINGGMGGGLGQKEKA